MLRGGYQLLDVTGTYTVNESGSYVSTVTGAEKAEKLKRQLESAKLLIVGGKIATKELTIDFENSAMQLIKASETLYGLYNYAFTIQISITSEGYTITVQPKQQA